MCILRTIAAVLLAAVIATSVSAGEKAKQFPLRLVVLSSSEFTESRPLRKSRCIAVGMGAPCVNEADQPARDISVVEVTGRITHRGFTTEYIFRCESRVLRRGPCREIKAATYSARWTAGQKLEVLVEEKPRKSVVYTFTVKAARVLE